MLVVVSDLVGGKITGSFVRDEVRLVSVVDGLLASIVDVKRTAIPKKITSNITKISVAMNQGRGERVLSGKLS